MKLRDYIMEQNKNRYSKPKFTKFEIVFLILAGVFFILAIVDKIISVHADEIIEPPHDPQYNNLVFITMSDEMIIGGDTVIELFEGSADGYYATIWKNNFIQAINDFFQYVPKDQCFIIVASDGATSAHMTAIREVLSDVGASYWSGSQDGYWDPNTDYSGYEDKRAPAGDYFIRYMSRIIKYSPTPSPTPDPSVTDSFGFIGYFSYDSRYYYVEFTGSDIFKSVTLDINDSDVASVMSELGTTDPNTVSGKSVYMVNSYSTGSSIIWQGPYAYLYFTGNINSVKVWRMSSSLISSDIDYIKANYNSVTLNGSDENRESYPWFSLKHVDDLNCLVINYDYYRNTGTYDMIDKLGNNIDILDSYSSLYKAFDNSVQLKKVYAALLTRSEEPVPTQDPNATPSPTPTDIPYIQIVTPPLPSPVGTIGFDDPGFSKLNSGAVNNQFDDFEDTLENNVAFGLLAMAFSFVPMEIRSIVWLILLIAIILATIRVFLHFFG